MVGSGQGQMLPTPQARLNPPRRWVERGVVLFIVGMAVCSPLPLCPGGGGAGTRVEGGEAGWHGGKRRVQVEGSGGEEGVGQVTRPAICRPGPIPTMPRHCA